MTDEAPAPGRPALAGGTWWIAPTPFAADGSVDGDALEHAVRTAVGLGRRRRDRARGDGRGDLALRRRAGRRARRRRRAAPATCPSPPAARAASAPLVAERAARAQEHGAVAAMVAAPPLVRDADTVVAFFGAVGERSPLPVLLQDEPVATGVQLAVSTLVEALGRSGAVAVKLEDAPTPPKITKLLAQVPDLTVYGGLGGVSAFAELSRGAAGTMTGFAYPEVLRAVRLALAAGDRVRAARVFDAFLPLIAFEGQPGYGLAIRKEVLRRRGALVSGRDARAGPVRRDRPGDRRRARRGAARVGLVPGPAALDVDALLGREERRREPRRRRRRGDLRPRGRLGPGAAPGTTSCCGRATRTGSTPPRPSSPHPAGRSGPSSRTRPTRARPQVVGDAALDAYGQVDVLVLNAGGPPVARADEVTADGLRAAFQLLAVTPVDLASAAAAGHARARLRPGPRDPVVRGPRAHRHPRLLQRRPVGADVLAQDAGPHRRRRRRHRQRRAARPDRHPARRLARPGRRHADRARRRRREPRQRGRRSRPGATGGRRSWPRSSASSPPTPRRTSPARRSPATAARCGRCRDAASRHRRPRHRPVGDPRDRRPGLADARGRSSCSWASRPRRRRRTSSRRWPRRCATAPPATGRRPGCPRSGRPPRRRSRG